MLLKTFFKITNTIHFPYFIRRLPLLISYNSFYRRSHLSCSKRKCVLRNIAKFTGKHLFQGLFFEFCEISKNTFFTEHLRTTASLFSSLIGIWLFSFQKERHLS